MLAEVSTSALELQLYRSMQIIRQTEEELARSHQRGLIHGACHTYVGQEAIAVGVCAHLGDHDVIFSNHRGHGHALAKGLPPEQLIAELFGRATGCSRGRGGSMHLFAPEIGLMGTSGIVGPSILQACGGGYSSKLRGDGTVAVAFFGDGAVNNGAFHEGLNMASIWKLPVLFVCENNQFATEVPFSYASGNPSVASRGAGYGIIAHQVDGNDVMEVYRIAGEAVRRARAGQGPTLLECTTYRTRAHAEGMGDFTYRTREEVQSWKEKCPLLRVRQHGGCTAAELDAIDAQVTQSVLVARQAAEGAPRPEGATATAGVYAKSRSVTSKGRSDHGGSKASSVAPGIRVSAAKGSLQVPPETNSASSLKTFSQATLEALSEAMAEDATIFVMGEGIGVRGGNFLTTKGLYDLYGPVRLCDTPICERGFVGLACGAAMTGTRPVIDFMFADFVLDSVGEIINQIAKMQYMSSSRLKMPVLLRGCIGIGHSAATHHSGSYYAMYGQVPGLRVVVPSDPADAKGLLKHALRTDDPVIFLEHREILQVKGMVPDGDYEIPFGLARVAREGKDATIVAVARMVHVAMAASELLMKEGISIEIIDPRTISPLDTDTILSSVAKTGRLLVVDEAPAQYGFSAEILASVADAGFDDLDAPLRRLTGAFCPTPYSPELETMVVPSLQQVVEAVRALVAE